MTDKPQNPAAGVAAVSPSEPRPAYYVASRASIPARSEMWRKLRSQGMNIVSSWIDEAGEGETESFEALWTRIENEIRSAAALLLYVETDDFPLKGALVEVGMALAMGKPVMIFAPGVEVEPRTWKPIGSWVEHPGVTVMRSPVEAFAAAPAVPPEPTPVGARLKALCDRLCIVELNPDGEPQWEVPAEPEPLYFDSPEDAIVGYVEMLGKECDRLEAVRPAVLAYVDTIAVLCAFSNSTRESTAKVIKRLFAAADSRAPAEADHIANPGKMISVEAVEALGRDVLALLDMYYPDREEGFIAGKIAALFDAAVKEPTT